MIITALWVAALLSGCTTLSVIDAEKIDLSGWIRSEGTDFSQKYLIALVLIGENSTGERQTLREQKMTTYGLPVRYGMQVELQWPWRKYWLELHWQRGQATPKKIIYAISAQEHEQDLTIPL